MKNTKVKKHLISAFLLSLFLLSQMALIQFSSPAPVQAESLWDMQKKSGIGVIGGQAFGNETPRDVRQIVVLVIKVFLGFLGLIFLALVVWAGFKYMTSGGSEEKVKEALDQIKTGVIGLIIILASYAITSYLTDCVFEITRKGESFFMCGNN